MDNDWEFGEWEHEWNGSLEDVTVDAKWDERKQAGICKKDQLSRGAGKSGKTWRCRCDGE